MYKPQVSKTKSLWNSQTRPKHATPKTPQVKPTILSHAVTVMAFSSPGVVYSCTNRSSRQKRALQNILKTNLLAKNNAVKSLRNSLRVSKILPRHSRRRSKPRRSSMTAQRSSLSSLTPRLDHHRTKSTHSTSQNLKNRRSSI